MVPIAYFYIAALIYQANTARRLAADARNQQFSGPSDQMSAAVESQLRQFANNVRVTTLNHELSVDMKFWPLNLSPAAVAETLSHEPRRPLLALFVPPPEMKSRASIDSYTAALKKFADANFAGASGGVSFQTGYWIPGRELSDAAVAALQTHLPDQPMVLLSFALLPQDRVDPRFAYLPGPGGARTKVMSLCEEPIDIGSLMRSAEEDRAGSRKQALDMLASAGFSGGEIQELFGAKVARNQLVERALRTLQAADADAAAIDALKNLYALCDGSLHDAEAGLVRVLELALAIAADGHNLLTRRLPPKLPELLADLQRGLPPAIAASIESAIDGYEYLFDFPALADLSAVAIARARLLHARAKLLGRSTTQDIVGGWAKCRFLDVPADWEDALQLLRQHALAADVGFAEVLGTILEENGENALAEKFYELADRLRILRAADLLSPEERPFGERT